jgi:hypothetical protein
VTETIAEYIRLYGQRRGRSKRERLQRASDLLVEVLAQARQHRERLESLDLSECNLTTNRWLCIVGVGEETRVKLEIVFREDGPWFNLTSRDRREGYRAGNGKPYETGDGTVPYLGARSRFIPVEKVICVTEDDFGYWELEDKLLARQTGLHAILPKMNLVNRLILAHFKAGAGRARGDDTLWARRPPDLPSESEWDPPIRALKDKTPG